MTKAISLTLIFSSIMIFVACEKMEDNYAQYLEKEKIYSPKVTNLRSYAGLKEVSLAWDNPEGSVAKGIIVDYQDSTFTSAILIDSIHITGLEIKGYTISVYTVDAYNNTSIPETISVFPNGE